MRGGEDSDDSRIRLSVVKRAFGLVDAFPEAFNHSVDKWVGLLDLGLDGY
jgi:hypothetical protein